MKVVEIGALEVVDVEAAEAGEAAAGDVIGGGGGRFLCMTSYCTDHVSRWDRAIQFPFLFSSFYCLNDTHGAY